MSASDPGSGRGVERSDGGQAGAGRIAALGEGERLRGFAFAGVELVPAEDPDAVRAAWRSLPADVELVILTAAAGAALAPELAARCERLWAVMPA